MHTKISVFIVHEYAVIVKRVFTKRPSHAASTTRQVTGSGDDQTLKRWVTRWKPQFELEHRVAQQGSNHHIAVRF